MSVNTILIHTQYFENYSDNATPYWKPKGEVTFKIELDADWLMYTNPESIFIKMLEKHCNSHCNYTYICYDIEWQEPMVLGTTEEFLKYAEN